MRTIIAQFMSLLTRGFAMEVLPPFSTTTWVPRSTTPCLCYLHFIATRTRKIVTHRGATQIEPKMSCRHLKYGVWYFLIRLSLFYISFPQESEYKLSPESPPDLTLMLDSSSSSPWKQSGSPVVAFPSVIEGQQLPGSTTVDSVSSNKDQASNIDAYDKGIVNHGFFQMPTSHL